MTLYQELGFDRLERVADGKYPTLKFGGRYLYSRYNPAQEAARHAARWADRRVCLVGFGLGYLVAALGNVLELLIVVEGEEVPTSAAAGSMVFVVAREELACKVLDAHRSGLEIVFDPMWAAAAEMVAELHHAMDSDAPGMRRDHPSSPEERRAAVDEATVERALAHQGRQHLADYDPIRVRLERMNERDPERILVLQPSSIGDVLYYTPVLEELRRLYPGAWIAGLVEREGIDVVRGGVPDLVIPARRSDWVGEPEVGRAGVRRLLERLAGMDFDLIINPHSSPRCAIYAATAAGPRARIIGLSLGDDGAPILRGGLPHLGWYDTMATVLQDRAAGPFLSPPDGVDAGMHVSAELARRSGAGRCPPRIRLPLDENDRESAKTWLQSHGLDGTPYVAVHTGSNDERRRYRRERWPEVIRLARERFSLPVILIGGPADRERNRWIAGQVGPIADATACGGLRFTAALLERARLLIGPETSTVHLAAAVACPALTITGRVASGWTGASSPRSGVLHGPGDPPWCAALHPETIVAAADYLLGSADRPSLPDGFEFSTTGDFAPSEFVRERHPEGRRSGAAYVRKMLGIAWQNLVSFVNSSWNYPLNWVNTLEALEWLGPADDEAKTMLRVLAKEARAYAESMALAPERRDFWHCFAQPTAYFSRGDAARELSSPASRDGMGREERLLMVQVSLWLDEIASAGEWHRAV